MRARLKLLQSPPAPRGDAFVGDDAELVQAFLRGDPGARDALYERHADHVHRVLYRILGFDRDLADLHHDVFVRALRSIAKIEDPRSLKGWLTMIAVHVAKSSITRRRRQRWLWFLPGDELPEVASSGPSGEVLDAMRATYAALEALPAEERIAFALRFIDDMELTEVAEACTTSLATVKRRLARAVARFEAEARRHPALEPWIEGGTRWANPSDR
ncbi:RNA polymerase sigma factor [Sorangium sp. So ce260]|uniref:RNA polymerase sigma factor n=1 Tax=Sorangium sp. So ce260 TaxID=3133291 RepID=UPI003F61C94A